MEMEKKTHYDTLETMHGTFQTTLTKKYLARKPWVPNNPKHIKSSIPGTTTPTVRPRNLCTLPIHSASRLAR